MGPVEIRAAEPPRAGPAQLAGVGPSRSVANEELGLKPGRLLQVDRPGLEPVRLAGRVPADRHGRLRQPDERPPARHPEPEVPVDHVPIGCVEAPGRRVRLGPQAYCRAAERVGHGHRPKRLAGPENLVGRTQAAPFDDARRDGAAPVVDHVGRRANQAGVRSSGHRSHVRDEVAGSHAVVLVEDRHQGRRAQGDAPVPVPGQAEPFGVDRDTGAVARLGTDEVERRVVGAVVGNDQVERDPLLRDDGPERFGQVPGSVAGRDRDGDRGAIAHVRVLCSPESAGLPAIDAAAGGPLSSTRRLTRELAAEPLERIPGVEARGVAVVPGKPNRVVADCLHTLKPQIVAD